MRIVKYWIIRCYVFDFVLLMFIFNALCYVTLYTLVMLIIINKYGGRSEPNLDPGEVAPAVRVLKQKHILF